MKPEELVEKMYDGSPCCSKYDCKEHLRVVLRAIQEGEVVTINYDCTVDNTGANLELTPAFAKFLEKRKYDY